MYSQKESSKIFFKGGTCLHLIFGSPRFSEDLDFSVGLEEKEFSKLIKKVFQNLKAQESVEFKEKKSLFGKFLLISKPEILPFKTFVNLEFSFREKVLKPEKSLLKTDFPVIFTSFVWHLSKEEIFAEKIRALMKRAKGRDLYDLWYLANLGTKFDENLLGEKLKFYKIKKVEKKEILEKIEKFSKKDFILDLAPFVSQKERKNLDEFFDYLKEYLKKEILTS